MSNSSWSAEDEVRRMKLLVFLADHQDGYHNLVSCFVNERGGWLTSNIAELAGQDLLYLANNGWIQEGRSWSAHATYPQNTSASTIGITDAGRSKAQEIKRGQADKPARVTSCRSSVLWWLYSEDTVSSSQSLPMRDFFSDRRSVSDGLKFTDKEVLAAYGWLHRQGLVAGTDPAEGQRRVHLHITDAGISCIEHYDGKVGDYLKAMEKQKPSHSKSAPVINIHGGQVQMATGEYSQQTMNVGLAAEQLVLVINGVAEMLRGLRLDGGQALALERAEQDAVEDVTSERPSGQGVRRFYDWVLRCVKQGGSAALTAAVTAAANGMLHDAEQLTHAIGR